VKKGLTGDMGDTQDRRLVNSQPSRARHITTALVNTLSRALAGKIFEGRRNQIQPL
jgi:hypothetical protein